MPIKRRPWSNCLHRDSLVPKDYTVSRFNKEFSGTDGNTSFDMQNLQVRSCLVPNGYNVGMRPTIRNSCGEKVSDSRGIMVMYSLMVLVGRD